MNKQSPYTSYINNKEEVCLYKYGYVEDDGNYYLKVIMNRKALDLGVIVDDQDDLFIIKINEELDDNVLYSNNRNLKADKYLNYSDVLIKSDVFSKNIEISYIEIDDTLEFDDADMYAFEKKYINLTNYNQLIYFSDDIQITGSALKNRLNNKVQFKIGIILFSSIFGFIGVIFALVNMFDDYIKKNINEIKIELIYYKKRRKYIFQFTNINYLINYIFILLGVILGFIFSKNMNITEFFITLIVYSIIIYLLLYLVINRKIKKYSKDLNIRCI
jgi:hypothetical protein